MRFSYAIALMTTLAVGGTYWYQSGSHVCPVPITYQLGTIDSSFSITRAEAIEAMELATLRWEEVAKQNLFVYDETDASVIVSFVFDDRQAEADVQAAEDARLDEVERQNNEIKTSIAQLQENYDAEQEAFGVRKEAYDVELAAYDDQVRQIEDRGGATEQEYQQLQKTKLELQTESQVLRSLASDLSQMADRLNQLSVEGNRLVRAYNAEVDQFNDRYGVGGEITQGDYTGDAIHIYKFSNENELVNVLAHEFGHALGISHVDEEGSLMHYLLEEGGETSIALTEADLIAYDNTCDMTRWDFSLRQKIRSMF